MEVLQAKPKVSVLRRAVTLLLAAIPVFLLFAGFLIAIQAVRFITSLYATDSQAQPPAQEQETPVEPSRPGVIMLMPDRNIPVDPAQSQPDQSQPDQGQPATHPPQGGAQQSQPDPSRPR